MLEGSLIGHRAKMPARAALYWGVGRAHGIGNTDLFTSTAPESWSVEDGLGR
jgi:hypothetical protein